MSIKTHTLEAELNATRKKLELAEQLIKKQEQEKEAIVREKDDQISDLNEKNRKCEITYDSIIQLTLDNFLQKLEIVKTEKWEPYSYSLQEKNKVLLAELGLKIHEY